MRQIPAPLSPDAWMNHLFSLQAAREGGLIRRQIRYVGRDDFVREMARRGYPVVESGGQFVICCNREPIRRIV